MSDKMKPEEPEQIECEVCMKEIPRSAAESFEVADYVHHFCGLECYGQWQKKAKQNKKTGKD